MPFNVTESLDVEMSNKTVDTGPAQEDLEFITYGIFVPVVMTFGYIGNIITAIVLWKKEMASITNLFLRALVVSDIALVTFASIALSLPTLVSKLVHRDLGFHVLLPHGFKTIDYLALTSQLCNEYILVFVSIERYIAICHPMKHIYIHSRKKVLYSIAGIICFALCYNVPRIISTEIQLTSCFDESYPLDCYVIKLSDFGNGFFYKSVYVVWMYTVIYFGIPLLSLLSLNILILRKLSKMRSRRRSLEACSSRVKKENTTILIVIIVIVFTICQTLGLFNQFQFLINKEKANASVQTNLTVIINFLYVMNSSINFIIYICVGKKFRRTFMVIFGIEDWNCRITSCFSGVEDYRVKSVSTNTASVL
ncbi:FMRFamide receptor-like [Mizuhopecten yessoensis]|uniref:FMRFamide receptor-like n=1 Tax=Mizuhopecten yessoensis TaxID=6573 RepID=UPI000B45E545|nr:FMRFamide receptor-like [Mizuhopecten yessoensis]